MKFAWRKFFRHVHEKAILLVTLPLTVLALTSPADAEVLPLLSASAHVSLMPLLFRPQEAALRVAVVLLHELILAKVLIIRYGMAFVATGYGLLYRLYVTGLVGLVCFDSLAQFMFPALPFLPLIAFSLYCSAGLLLSWLKLYAILLRPAAIFKSKLR